MSYLTQSIKLETILKYGKIINVTNEARPDYLDPRTTKYTFQYLVNENQSDLDFCGFYELSIDVNTVKDFINRLYIILTPLN
jgi:hypothetical protein